MQRALIVIIGLIVVFAGSLQAAPVSRVGAWSTGLTHTVGAGTDRLLIFEIGYEHNAGDLGNASAVTYGGQPLTLITGAAVVSSNSFAARAQLWYLDEAGISAATGNTFLVTWPSGTPQVPAYGAATFQNVDQISPIGDFSSATVDGSTPNPITTSINVVADGLSVAAAQSGNIGSYVWNNGWLEVIDQNPSSSTNSAADNLETADGTSTASATHSNPNRQALVAVSLAPFSNLAPVVTDIPDQTVAEGSSFTTINLDDYVSDPDNLDSELSWSYSGNSSLSVDITARVATITTPDADWNGSETITFTASDPGLLSDSDPATFTVTPVNDNPTVVSAIPDTTVSEDNAPIDNYRDLTTVFSDIEDGTALTYSIESNSNPGLLTATLDVGDAVDLSFAADSSGFADIVVRATDGGSLFAEDTFRVTVTPVNDNPTVVSAIPDTTVSEDNAPIDNYRDLTTVFSDIEDGTALTYSIESNSNPGLLTATLDVGDAVDLSFAADSSGFADIVVRATDGGSLFAEDTFRVTVTPVNDNPTVVSAIPDTTVSEDNAPIDNYRDLTTVFSDIEDGTALTYSIESNSNPGLLTATLDVGDAVDLSFAADSSGFADIVVRATDGGLLFAEDTFRVTVTPVNDNPTVVSAIPDTTVSEDNAPIDNYRDLTTVFSDIEDGTALTYSIESNSNPGLLTATLDVGDAVDLSFAADSSGFADIVVRATDGGLLFAEDTFRVTVTPVNDNPTVVSAIPDTTVSEDNAPIDNYRDLTTVFSDIEDGTALTYSIESNSNPGLLTATLDVGDAVDLSFAADSSGFADIVVRATDGGLLFAEDTFRVTVTATGDSPVVTDIPDQTVAEGSSFTTINLDDYVSDPDNLDSELSWSYSGNSSLSVDITARVATITTPDADWNGSETITFTASDPGLLSDSDPATFTVTPVNDNPTVVSAIPDTTVSEDNAPIDNYRDLTTVFSDIEDGTALTYSIESNSNPGLLTATLDVGDAVDLSFAADSSGFADIVVRATDGGLLFAEDTFRVTVTPVNDNPTVVSAIPDTTVSEDNAPIDNYRDLTTVFSDIEDGTALTYSIESNSNPGLLTATLDVGDAVDLSFAADSSGFADIVVRATDGGSLFAEDTFRVTVTPVNDNPTVVSAIPDTTVSEDNAPIDNYRDLTTVFSDIEDGTALTYSIESNSNPGLLTATLDVGDAVDLSFAADSSGFADIVVRATDGGLLFAEDTFRVTVTATGDSPVVTDIPDQTVAEGSSFTTINLDDYVSDPDNLDSELSWSYSGNSSLSVDITARVATITTPDADWNGSETITFTASDPGLLSDSDPATFTVTPVNDNPTVVSAIPDTTVSEDNAPIDNYRDLTTVFSDIEDGTALTYSIESNSNPGLLTATLDVGDAVDLSIAADSSGFADIVVRATDGGSLFAEDTFRVTVTPVNDNPTVVSAIPDTTVSEDNAPIDNYRDLTTVFSDIEDGTALTYSIESNSNPGLLTATLDVGDAVDLSFAADSSGFADIVVRATDGGLLFAEDTFRVTVTPVNDNPTVVSAIPDTTVSEDNAPIDNYRDLTTVFSDIEDGTALTYSIESNSNPGLLTATLDVGDAVDLSFAADSSGFADIVVRATDGGSLFAEDTFRVTVTPVNDNPTVVSAIPDTTVSEDNAPIDNYRDLTTVFSDIEDGTALTYSIESNSNPGLLTATLDVGDAVDLSFAADSSGFADIVVRATDGGLLFAEDTFRVTVTATGDSPVVTDIPDQTVAEGSSFTTINLDDYVSDPDNLDSELSWSYSGNSSLSVDITARVATITTPDADWNGSETITFTASDPGLLSDSDPATFTVTPVNDNPTLSAIGDQGTIEGVLLAFVISASDPDGPTVNLSSSTLPSGAAFSDNGNGTGGFDWTPSFVQSGSYSVTFYATDGIETDSEQVLITVTDAGNQPPVLDPIGPKSTPDNVNLTFGITASDAESTPILTTSTLPSGATFIDHSNGAGMFSWTPSTNDTGTHDVTFYATDDSSAVDSEHIQITVTFTDVSSPIIVLNSPPNDSMTTNPFMALDFSISDQNLMNVWVFGGVDSTASELLDLITDVGDSNIVYNWDARKFMSDPAKTMGLWHFDEASGTFAGDASSNGNHGQTVGGPVRSTAGRFGGAIDFDGIDDFVQIPDATSLDVAGSTGAVTIEAWVYPRGGGGTFQSIVAKRGFGKRARAVNYEMALQQFNSKLTFIAGEESIVYVSSVTVPLNQWSYIAISVKAVEGRARFYLNGIAVDSIDAVTLGNAHDEPLYIGAAGTSTEAFDGLIDEVRLSNKVLQSGEIAANYTVGHGMHYWKVVAEDVFANSSTSETRRFVADIGCCEFRADVNADGALDISDLTYYVAYLFGGGPEAVCPDQGDINGDGSQDISDLTYLVAYLFGGGPAPPGC